MKKWLTPSVTTWMHRSNPVFKLVAVLLMFLIGLFTHRIDLMFYQALLSLLLLFCLSGYAFWKVAVMVVPFLLIFVSSSSTMILFGKGDTLWWEWGLFRITEESFFRGIHIGFKSVTFAAQGLLFVLTTSSVDLFYALMQKVKLPPKYAYSFMAAIRLIPMVWEEFQTRRNALSIRGTQSLRGPGSWIGRIRLYAVPLLSQSIRRAHAVAIAMESKAFNGQRMRTYYYPSSFSGYDLLIAVILCSMIGLVFLLGDIAPLFPIEDVRFVGHP